jgi:hypothetical protein
MKCKLILAVFLFKSTCLMAQTGLLSSSTATIKPLTINTSKSEIGSAIINGELYYSSLSNEEQEQSLGQFFNIFSIPLNEAFIHDQKGRERTELNSEYHDGSASYCEATRELFVTRSEIENVNVEKGIVQKKYVPLGIVIYKQEHNHWVYIGEFPFNSSEYSVGQPAINETGDSLVFVSNMPGGYGETDLYLSVQKNGTWQKPQNLGKRVNSKKTEMTPFFSSDGKFYFASNRRHGRGGLDLYWTVLAPSADFSPQNLGKTINSKSDDLGLVIHPNQKIGFFTSNRRSGKGEDDIYCVKVKDYDLKIEPINDAKSEVKQIAEKIDKDLKDYLDQKKKEDLISNNVIGKVNFEILKANELPDLKITFGYDLSSDTLRFGQNSFKLFDYQVENSNAAMAIITVMKKYIEEELNKYFSPEKRITISINGNGDAFPLGESVQYKGEFGNSVRGECQAEDTITKVVVNNNTPLNNEQLAFLRCYSVKNYITKNIEPFKNTRNSFCFQTMTGEQLSRKKDWFTIQITIQNPFGNF